MAPRLRQVITMGTPFSGKADHTHAGWLYRLLSGSAPVVDPALNQRLRTPPQLPATSIYSRSDGVVDWQSCRHDKTEPQVTDVEVKGSPIGMGWNPAVLRVVAHRLARSAPV